MKYRKLKALLYGFILVTIVGVAAFYYYRYHGILLGEEHSPDGKYSLRYYRAYNPFVMVWSMPGDSACKPRWIRLYGKDGDKLEEMYTTDCSLENPVYWLDSELILPDGDTIWRLPEK
jgi:hypothetical protein